MELITCDGAKPDSLLSSMLFLSPFLSFSLLDFFLKAVRFSPMLISGLLGHLSPWLLKVLHVFTFRVWLDSHQTGIARKASRVIQGGFM